jgi:protein arginine N-methyltransferase 1
VDTVDSKAINSSMATVLDLDLNTVTVADLSFKSDFEVTIQRDDVVHGIVSWFDIWFNSAHKPVYFSTGPHAKYTHWKQTVLYTKEDEGVRVGDKIQGTIECKPNSRNHRDLDIELQWSHFAAESTSGEPLYTENQNYHMC